MRPTRIVRNGLMLAAAGSFALVGLTTTAAQAAGSPATVSVHIANGEAGLGNIQVYAISSDRFVDLGQTDGSGDLTNVQVGPNGGSKLKSGTYELAFIDADSDRYDAQSTYVYKDITDVRIRAGANTLPEVDLVAGGSVSATVETPSGKPLGGLGYRLLAADAPNSTGAQYGDGTDEDGTFQDQGKEVGSYRIDYQRGTGSTYIAAPETFSITEPGQHVDTVFHARVKPDVASVVGSSTSKGTATMIVKIANNNFGILDPHGVVTIKNSKGQVIADPVPVTEVNGKGKATITLPASSGKHTFTAVYGNGGENLADLADTSLTTTFTVK